MKFKIWSALIAVYIVWGSTYLAIRFAVQTMPPFLMAATRFLIAGGLLYAWRRLSGDPRPTRAHWGSAAVVGLFLLLGGNGSVTWAEQHVPSGIAALIVGSAPLWMVLIDAVRPPRRPDGKPAGSRLPGWQTLAGVLIGFGGILLLIGPWELAGNGQHFDPVGISVLMLAAFLWAVGSIFSRGAHLPDSPLMGTGLEMLAGGLGLLVVGTLSGEWARLDIAAISIRSLLGLGYLIVFGALVGFVAYTWLLRVAPTPLVATYAYVNPLIAIFVGNLLAGEALTARIIASAVIIISSVALINTSRKARPKEAAEMMVESPYGD